ncbi:MAG: histidine kinase [Gemmatimonadota bacterium]
MVPREHRMPSGMQPQPRRLRSLAEESRPPRWAVDEKMGWRGLLLIFGFWTLFGAVMAVNLLVSPLRESSPPMSLVTFTYLGAYAWAALTLPVFWITRRVSEPTGHPIRRFALLFGLGFSLALVVSSVIAILSARFLDQLVGGTLSGWPGVFEIARYRFLNDLLASLLIIAAGIARDYFVRFQARQEEAILLRAQLVEARLEVLRTQLNPHFLFNTLNAVSALVAKNPKGVRRIIALLSELLRYSLENASEPETPLDRELKMLERYLQILEIRYHGRLEIHIEVDPDVRDALVPDLILQPLAENAMKHGVGRSGGHGRIGVEARRLGGRVVLRVSDSGAGGAPRVVVGREAERRSGGFGLRQIRERLEQLYGDDFRLELSATTNGGTTAEIEIPYHTSAAARALPRAADSPALADA